MKSRLTKKQFNELRKIAKDWSNHLHEMEKLFNVEFVFDSAMGLFSALTDIFIKNDDAHFDFVTHKLDFDSYDIDYNNIEFGEADKVTLYKSIQHYLYLQNDCDESSYIGSCIDLLHFCNILFEYQTKVYEYVYGANAENVIFDYIEECDHRLDLIGSHISDMYLDLHNLKKKDKQ